MQAASGPTCSKPRLRDRLSCWCPRPSQVSNFRAETEKQDFDPSPKAQSLPSSLEPKPLIAGLSYHRPLSTVNVSLTINGGSHNIPIK